MMEAWWIKLQGHLWFSCEGPQQTHQRQALRWSIHSTFGITKKNRQKNHQRIYFAFLRGQVVCELLKTTSIPCKKKRVVHMTCRQGPIWLHGHFTKEKKSLTLHSTKTKRNKHQNPSKTECMLLLIFKSETFIFRSNLNVNTIITLNCLRYQLFLIGIKTRLSFARRTGIWTLFLSLSFISAPPQMPEPPSSWRSHVDKASGSTPGSRLFLRSALSETTTLIYWLLAYSQPQHVTPQNPQQQEVFGGLGLFCFRLFSAYCS